MDHNKYIIQYRTVTTCLPVPPNFAALTLKHVIGQDDVWETSLVTLKKLSNSCNVSEASVTRNLTQALKPAERLSEFS